MYLSGTNELTADATAVSHGELVSRVTQGSTTYGRGIDMCRLLDLFVAATALLFVAPLMLTVALLIKLQDGGPILFGHGRVGLDGQAFKCWKFRSMVVGAEARLAALLARDPAARLEWEADHKLRADPRVTAFGRFLRVSSIDELPQLFNVLKGDMSLVGPRPIVTAETERYGRWLNRYTRLRPGITGLWQISGRNDVSYAKRVAFDVLYSRRRSVTYNFQILLATIPAVLTRSGSY